MYFLPGYIKIKKQEGAIFLTSEIFENTVKLHDPEIIEEFSQIQSNGSVDHLSTSLTHFLHEQEMLVTQQEAEATIQSLRDDMENYLPLTIMPTEVCNFRCPYCYQAHDAVTMSQNTLHHILKYIGEQAPKFKHIQVNWFGGEPTLGKNIILKTSDYIHDLQKEYPFSYRATMSTNGYLLDAESFKQYYQADITRYMITLDGWGHDKTRPHVSSGATLSTILGNLDEISSLDPSKFDFTIILRHNILNGDEDYSWYDHLYQRFGHDPRFAVLVRPVGDWGGDTVKNLSILNWEDRNALLLKHIHYIQKLGMRCENGCTGLLSKLCHVSYPHSLVFRPNGKIEKCTIIFDHPKNLVGYVDEERGVTLDEDAIAMWNSTNLKPGCYRCSDVASCLNMQCIKDHVLGMDSNYECSQEQSLIY